MKNVVGIALLFVSGCVSTPPICGERTYHLEIPGVPLFGELKYVKANNHVDCDRDPAERELPDDE